MGNTLESPVTEKKTCSGKLPGTAIDQGHFGLSSCQGWRINNEDMFICLPRPYMNLQSQSKMQNQDSDSDAKEESDMFLADHAVFGIFDGHGGPFAAEYASKYFYNILCCQQKFVEYCTQYHHLEKKAGQRQEGRKQKKSQRKKHRHKLSIGSNSSAGVDTIATDEGMINLLQAALRSAFLEVDRQMLIEMNQIKNLQGQKGDENDDDINQGYTLFDTGTAAIVIIITPTHIICANAGDCRAVLCRRCDTVEDRNCNTVMPLSFDHKPDIPEEENRIIKAGGVVCSSKVDGLLALSRALGDFSFKDKRSVLVGVGNLSEKVNGRSLGDALKISESDPDSRNELYTKPEDQKVSPVPDFIVVKREPLSDLSIVAGCDGIWDVVSNKECANTVSQIFQEGETALSLVAEEMIDICLKRGSRDNMTVLVVKFPSQTIGKGGGVAKRRKRRQVLEAEKSIRNKKSNF